MQLEEKRTFVTAAFVIILILSLYFGFVLLANEVANMQDASLSLPLMAIGGVIVLILVMTTVAVAFQWLGLADSTQAMGLPEGSIRAVIALSLIVLFAILSVYLYQGIGGQVSTIQHLSREEMVKISIDLKDAPGLRSVPQAKDDKNPAQLYNISFRTKGDAAADDFAKQLLVLLGTLMTAVTSFYLGAGTTKSAQDQVAKAIRTPIKREAQGADPAQKPVIERVNPKVHDIGKLGKTINLVVFGSNLDKITQVKIVSGKKEIVGTNVNRDTTQVTCSITVDDAVIAPGLPWDVVITDGVSEPITSPAALTIT